MNGAPDKHCVLVFAGADPSGGAGIQADIEAISALGAHALPVITLLTVQDNERVFALHPVPADVVRQQALALIGKVRIAAVKIGALGTRENAQAVAELVAQMKIIQPDLPVVLDPVLASGRGDALAAGDAVAAIFDLRSIATLITPNLPEAMALSGTQEPLAQMKALLEFAPHVLLKGGHAQGAQVENLWRHGGESRSWRWPRLAGGFHGSGCTLASAIAALLACGQAMPDALDLAQRFCHESLANSYSIAPGQRIPNRTISRTKEKA